MTVKFRTGILRYTFIAAIFVAFATGSFMAKAAEEEVRSTYTQADAGTAPRHDLIQGAHVEGHIAFLKAELGITPAQENLWEPVAAAMREDVRNLQVAENNAASQMRGPETAIQYLHNRVIFARLRADGEARFLAAFQPVYEKLSDQQKRIADELLIPEEP